YLREALVPTDDDDDDAGNRRLLFDWELNEILTRIALRTSSVSVVLDTCFSASITRDGLDDGPSTVRYSPTLKPLTIGAEREPAARGAARGLGNGPTGELSIFHVVASCRDDEPASERGAEGRTMGVFSRALCAELAKWPPEELRELRWGAIWRPVFATVQRSN